VVDPARAGAHFRVDYNQALRQSFSYCATSHCSGINPRKKLRLGVRALMRPEKRTRSDA
jgi:hypothetical protein